MYIFIIGRDMKLPEDVENTLWEIHSGAIHFNGPVVAMVSLSPPPTRDNPV